MVENFVDYKYDGLSCRIAKLFNGSKTDIKSRVYIYDNEDILEERSGDGATVLARYTHGPGIDEPLIMERSGQSYFYHSDGLGSITSLTDSTGNIVKSYVYDSFGQIKNETGAVENFYTYTSREKDSESGLYYYRARYYDASRGRFLQEDPIGITDEDVNLYVYVWNNPVNYIDPTGLHSIWVCKRLCDIQTGIWLNACRLGYRICASACPGICAPTGPLIGPCIIACELACADGVVVCNTAVYKWNEQCKHDCERHKHYH